MCYQGKSKEMRLLYVLPILFGVCACGKDPVFVEKGMLCNGVDDINQTTDVKLYKDYAVVSINNKDVILKKTKVLNKNFAEYSSKENKLDFYMLSSKDFLLPEETDVEIVKIGFVLNNRKCFFNEFEKGKIHQHLQAKDIDESIKEKLTKIF